ncbi:prolyl 4-hydroxylase subunit alpha-1 [Ixodes scapularis]
MSPRTLADPLVNVVEMRKQRLLPRDEDFTGLAGSLVRLQDTYALDLHELTKGHIRSEILRNRSVPGRLPLNAKDCFNISQVALRHGFYDRAVEWAEQAIAKATQEQPFTIPKQELDTFYKAAIEKHDEVLSTMGEAGEHWQTYGVPVRERANRSTEFKAQLFDEEIEDDQVNENYKRLCRGEQLRSYWLRSDDKMLRNPIPPLTLSRKNEVPEERGRRQRWWQGLSALVLLFMDEEPVGVVQY